MVRVRVGASWEFLRRILGMGMLLFRFVFIGRLECRLGTTGGLTMAMKVAWNGGLE